MHRTIFHGARVLAVVAGVIAVDQTAKVLTRGVHAAAVVPARNPGVVTGWSPVSVTVLIVATFVVLALFIGFIGRWAVEIGITPIIPAIVVGGVLAQTIDRIRFGAVRDFLATGWLIVDVGDIAVALGLAALIAAFAIRLHQLRSASRTITLELPSLRAVVVDLRSARAA